jgi:glucokinase
MYLAIDVGGTFTKYALFDSRKKEVDGIGGRLITKDPLETMAFVMEKAVNTCTVEKVGVSVAANVNNSGEIVHSTNLIFPQKFNLVEFFEKKWSIECKVVNDADAATLGLTAYKEYKRFKTLVGVTLGTGVGGGLIINGKLLTSESGFAGEIGHMVIVDNGLQCACGKKGCLEAYCGAKGIELRYKQLVKTNETISPEEINVLANSGNKHALKVIEETGELLGKGFAIISDIIAPDAFVLTGGITGFGDIMIKPIERTMRQLCFSRVSKRFPCVLINRYGNSALQGLLMLFDG